MELSTKYPQEAQEKGKHGSYKIPALICNQGTWGQQRGAKKNSGIKEWQ